MAGPKTVPLLSHEAGQSAYGMGIESIHLAFGCGERENLYFGGPLRLCTQFPTPDGFCHHPGSKMFLAHACTGTAPLVLLQEKKSFYLRFEIWASWWPCMDTNALHPTRDPHEILGTGHFRSPWVAPSWYVPMLLV